MADALGFEIGGVLYEQLPAIDDRSLYGDRFIETPEVDSAFDALRELASCFGERRYGIVTCGPETEERIRAWLASRDFVRRAEIPEGNLHFCRKAPHKVSTCKALGLSHMVDDSFPDLLALRSIRTRFLFRGKMHEMRRHMLSLKHVTCVTTWNEILAHLR